MFSLDLNINLRCLVIRLKRLVKEKRNHKQKNLARQEKTESSKNQIIR